MIGRIGNIFVSVQCSECQSGEKFKQTRVNGGSIYDSLKVTSALNFQSDGIQTSVVPSETLAQRRLGEHLHAGLLVSRERLLAGDEQGSRRGRCCSTQAILVISVNTHLPGQN